MPGPRPKPKHKKHVRVKLLINPDLEIPSRAWYRKWPVAIAGIFAIFLVILLLSRPREEKVDVTTTPATQTGVPGEVTGIPPVNKLPEMLSIQLSPKVVYPGDKIEAEVEGKDEDGDAVEFYYEWRKNGEILAEERSSELDTTGFKKGDLIMLYVTPFDGKEEGKTRWSSTLMIANSPPQITSIPTAAVSNGQYVYEVKANDPDGDDLTFSLENAPPDMTIDPSTGVMQWNIPAEHKESYDIMIVVTDGDARAFQGFTINLQMER